MGKITTDQVREALDYCASTGVFRWRKRVANTPPHKAWNTKYAGTVAGCLTNRGYREVSLFDRKYFAHRLAWAHFYGVWPTAEIDHIDGDKLNNAIANLREATRQQNQCNCGPSRVNTSGFKGVTFHKRRGKWLASIKSYGQTHELGFFTDPAEAHRAYAEAAAKLHGEFARVS